MMMLRLVICLLILAAMVHPVVPFRARIRGRRLVRAVVRAVHRRKTNVVETIKDVQLNLDEIKRSLSVEGTNFQGTCEAKQSLVVDKLIEASGEKTLTKQAQKEIENFAIRIVHSAQHKEVKQRFTFENGEGSLLICDFNSKVKGGEVTLTAKNIEAHLTVKPQVQHTQEHHKRGRTFGVSRRRSWSHQWTKDRALKPAELEQLTALLYDAAEKATAHMHKGGYRCTGYDCVSKHQHQEL